MQKKAAALIALLGILITTTTMAWAEPCNCRRSSKNYCGDNQCADTSKNDKKEPEKKQGKK